MQQPWLTNTCFNPLSGPALSQAHPEEWDPLDPSNLARIADPHQTNSFETQKSTTLAGVSTFVYLMKISAKSLSSVYSLDMARYLTSEIFNAFKILIGFG